VARIVGQIRESWPHVRFLVRADSGFARDELMAWCEANGVDYVFGLARNQRLVGAIAEHLAAAEAESLAVSGPARRFADFFWRTLDSWSRERRVVAKAEHLPQGSNPRFVVTSLEAGTIDARTLYEDLYCGRGEVENRIKEQQLDLFADRTSAATMRANQLRLWFASFAYVLLDALRRIGLRHTRLAAATCGTIRLKLLKIGPQKRTPHQGGDGLGVPLPDRVPARLSLPQAPRLLSVLAYRLCPHRGRLAHAQNPPRPALPARNARKATLLIPSRAQPPLHLPAVRNPG
jgi:Transposase DDE domain group 1